MRFIILVSILCSSVNSFAGKIRTVHMNADKMKSVYLKMGQSTVIRFTDKPVKVVIGNQNFYSVEFIDSDVTIQPLGAVKTNLFVYTAHYVYGFILSPSHGGQYDDIVNVRWASSGIVLKQKKKKSFTEKKLSQKLKLGKIEVDLKKVIINKDRKTHIIEFEVLNNSLEKIKTKELKFYLTRSGKNLEVQEYALSEDTVYPLKKVMGRLLVKLSQAKGFTFSFEHKKKKKSVIISRWSL